MDFGVAYDAKGRKPLTRVVKDPRVGQYVYFGGAYTFNSAERKALFIMGETSE